MSTDELRRCRGQTREDATLSVLRKGEGLQPRGARATALSAEVIANAIGQPPQSWHHHTMDPKRDDGGQSKERIELDIVSIWIDRSHNVIRMETRDRAKVDLPEARRCTEALTQLTGGQPWPVLVDYGRLGSISKEARDYFTKDPEHAKLFTSVAIVAANPLARVIGNFFLGLNLGLTPTKLFGDVQSALSWLTHRASSK